MSDYAVNVTHTGGLSFEVSNGRTTLATDWDPQDQSWLATELFLASLGACMLATLVDYAQTHDLDVRGATVEVTADTEVRPMRMGRIFVTYRLPDTLTPQQVEALVRAGDRCKVHNTITHHPEFVVQAETVAVETIDVGSREGSQASSRTMGA
ncbi:MAG TPA: OsmC family protein [Actinopolymorphaceae bacterium]